MQQIFYLLHKSGIRKDTILKAIHQMPEVNGIKNCIKLLKSNGFDIIIISDSNSQFISMWNRYHEIDQYIDHIFTNPAKFSANGVLEIQPYHIQKECQLSSVNLCKGKILEHYISEKFVNFGVKYTGCLFYIGDGKNDICPILRLPKNGGFGCVRSLFFADREIDKYIATHNVKCKAKLLRWTDGSDLMDKIFENVNITI